MVPTAASISLTDLEHDFVDLLKHWIEIRSAASGFSQIRGLVILDQRSFVCL